MGISLDLGFDLSLDGVLKVGDSFLISYNIDGFNDNSNVFNLVVI